MTSAWDQIDSRQTGHRVTFTPTAPRQNLPAGAQLTCCFQVGQEADLGMPVSCGVNEVPCAGLA